MKATIHQSGDNVKLVLRGNPTFVVRMTCEEARVLLLQTQDSWHKHSEEFQSFLIGKREYHWNVEEWQLIHTVLKDWYELHVAQLLDDVGGNLAAL